MGRHTVLEGLEVERELLWVHTALLDACHHLVVVVDALRTAVYLKTAEQQVKAARFSFRVAHRIEGAGFRRELSDEDKVAIVLLKRACANVAFMFRRHVVVGNHTERFMRFGRSKYRKLLPDVRTF